MLKLQRLSLSGFKSIAEVVDLELGPLNVLIGANGAGKSNLVGFFRMLSFMMTGALQDFIGRSGRAQTLLHYGPKVTPHLTAALEIATEKGLNRYECRLAYAAEDTLIFTDERASFQRTGAPGPPHYIVLGAGHRETALRNANAETGPTQTFIAGALSRLRVYQFHDTSDESRLRATCDVDDSRFLYSNGGNLAAMLLRLREEHPERYDRLLGTVRLVAPFLEDFVLEPVGDGRKWLSLRWRGRGVEYEFGPHQLSDGTLRFIALATLLLQPVEWLPSLIVIDEPELGLHPVALATLVELLSEAALDAQLLVATQSSALLDFVEPAEVIVAEREDGASVFRRLDEGKLKEWLEDYSLGEVWRRNLMAGGPLHE